MPESESKSIVLNDESMPHEGERDSFNKIFRLLRITLEAMAPKSPLSSSPILILILFLNLLCTSSWIVQLSFQMSFGLAVLEAVLICHNVL